MKFKIIAIGKDNVSKIKKVLPKKHSTETSHFKSVVDFQKYAQQGKTKDEETTLIWHHEPKHKINKFFIFLSSEIQGQAVDVAQLFDRVSKLVDPKREGNVFVESSSLQPWVPGWSSNYGIAQFRARGDTLAAQLLGLIDEPAPEQTSSSTGFFTRLFAKRDAKLAYS